MAFLRGIGYLIAATCLIGFFFVGGAIISVLLTIFGIIGAICMVAIFIQAAMATPKGKPKEKDPPNQPRRDRDTA